MVKTLGDGLVCAFEDPDDAFRAACEMQTTVHAAAQGTANRLQIKIGFTSGPVMLSRRRRLRRHGERLLAPGGARQSRAGADHAADRGGALAGPAHPLPADVPDPRAGKAEEMLASDVHVALRPGRHRDQPDARAISRNARRPCSSSLPGQHLHRAARDRPDAAIGRDKEQRHRDREPVRLARARARASRATAISCSPTSPPTAPSCSIDGNSPPRCSCAARRRCSASAAGSAWARAPREHGDHSLRFRVRAGRGLRAAGGAGKIALLPLARPPCSPPRPASAVRSRTLGRHPPGEPAARRTTSS